MSIQRIGVAGAGLMGGGIAQVCAQAGIRVQIHDAIPGKIPGAGVENDLGGTLRTSHLFSAMFMQGGHPFVFRCKRDFPDPPVARIEVDLSQSRLFGGDDKGRFGWIPFYFPALLDPAELDLRVRGKRGCLQQFPQYRVGFDRLAVVQEPPLRGVALPGDVHRPAGGMTTPAACPPRIFGVLSRMITCNRCISLSITAPAGKSGRGWRHTSNSR